MIEDMYSVFQRINEITKRFGLNRNNQATNSSFKDATLMLQRDAENNNKMQENGNNAKNERLSQSEIKDIVKMNSKRYGIPSSLVNAVIETESGYNQFAVSKKGAIGLMQLMPGLAKEMGLSDPFIPEQNIRGGISHLSRLLQKYQWDYKKALSAYNAGESAVKKRGVPPYEETKDYVNRVINAYLKNSE